jgi:hypothetical protein
VAGCPKCRVRSPARVTVRRAKGSVADVEPHRPRKRNPPDSTIGAVRGWREQGALQQQRRSDPVRMRRTNGSRAGSRRASASRRRRLGRVDRKPGRIADGRFQGLARLDAATASATDRSSGNAGAHDCNATNAIADAVALTKPEPCRLSRTLGRTVPLQTDAHPQQQTADGPLGRRQTRSPVSARETCQPRSLRQSARWWPSRQSGAKGRSPRRVRIRRFDQTAPGGLEGGAWGRQPPTALHQRPADPLGSAEGGRVPTPSGGG